MLKISTFIASTLNTHSQTQSQQSSGSSGSKSSKKILNGGWVDVQLRTISHQVHDMDRLENGHGGLKSVNVNGKVIIVQNEEV